MANTFKTITTAILITVMATQVTYAATSELNAYKTPTTISVSVTSSQTPYTKSVPIYQSPDAKTIPVPYKDVLMVPFNLVFETLGATTETKKDVGIVHSARFDYAEFGHPAFRTVNIFENNKKNIYVSNTSYPNETEWEFRNGVAFVPASSITKATKHLESQNDPTSRDFNSDKYLQGHGVLITYDDAAKKLTLSTAPSVPKIEREPNEPYRITDLGYFFSFEKNVPYLHISESVIAKYCNGESIDGGIFKIEQINPNTGEVIKDLGTFTAGKMEYDTRGGSIFIGNVQKDGTYRITTVSPPVGYRFATVKETANQTVSVAKITQVNETTVSATRTVTTVYGDPRPLTGVAFMLVKK